MLRKSIVDSQASHLRHRSAFTRQRCSFRISFAREFGIDLASKSRAPLINT